MLPSSTTTKQPPPPDHHQLLHSIKSRISPRNLFFLIATIFLQLLVIAILNRASTSLPSSPLHQFQSPTNTPVYHDDHITTDHSITQLQTPTPPKNTAATIYLDDHITTDTTTKDIDATEYRSTDTTTNDTDATKYHDDQTTTDTNATQPEHPDNRATKYHENTTTTTELKAPDNKATKYHENIELKSPDNNNENDTTGTTCPNGRVYVYDLPPILNKDLLSNCHDLDPWASRCNAVSNSGFGPPATGLDQIVPKNLTPSWYWTDMYAAEVIYHNRMLHYSCRTLNQTEASAFYIPFYVGLAVGKYLWYNYTSRDRDFHSVEMLKWVSNQVSWKRGNGSDHFIMLGRLTWDFRRQTESDKEWGTSFIYMPLMKNVLRLSVERSQWDELEISVPYPTAFHPRSVAEIRQWQELIRNRKRSSLFSFVGATRKKIKNDFRGLLMRYAKKEAKSSPVRVVDCSIERCYDGAPAILEAFLDSDFCLQPKGDGFTRRSAYDCMLAGSIPVYFWRGSFKYQFEWHLPKAAETYSVFIDRNGVRNGTAVIRKVLEKYSREEVKKMRETIIDFMPRFLYSTSDADLGGVWDAFDIAMDGVLRRFSRRKMIAT